MDERTPEANRKKSRPGTNRVRAQPGGGPYSLLAAWRLRRSKFEHWRLRRRRSFVHVWHDIPAPWLLILSFAAFILIGTLGLRWLPGLYQGAGLSWVDALFTATSAVCITGLSVVETGSYFTILGQAWLLLFAQMGALGILVFTSGILLSVGRRLSLRNEQLLAGSDEQLAAVDYRSLVRRVIRLTLTLESLGALAFYVVWVDDFGWIGAIWPAVFHAVNAFCNSGFTTFSDSFISQQSSPAPLVIAMVLIVLGGLGFLTLAELWRERSPWGQSGRPRNSRISIHSRFVLVSSAVATVAGALMILHFEATHAFAAMPPVDRLLNATFASVTARSGGFATVDYGAITAPTAFTSIVLMFIGGAPGSTAGGIKITTAALILTLAVARLRGDSRVSAWGRSVPTDTVQRAISIAVIGMAVLVVMFILLISVEPAAQAQDAFLRYMFEATSAFGTVGLSMNITPALTPAGRVIITLLMFVGRVGLLTAAAAIVLQRKPGDFRYAHEDVAVG